MNNGLRFFFTMSLMLVSGALAAQDWKNESRDRIYKLAQTEAFAGRRNEAREMLTFLITKSSADTEAKILLARTYAWDGNYNEARQRLQDVLLTESANEDALSALTDVEVWSEHFSEALVLADQLIAVQPHSQEYLFKRATALNRLGRDEEALNVLQQVLTINPGHEQASRLFNAIKLTTMKYTASVSYTVDVFNKVFDPAHYASGQLTRVASWGSVVARVNYAKRFSETGVQPEIDLYPRLGKGLYAYLNYGFSNSILFPSHRTGIELYKTLPRRWEISVGARYLSFDAPRSVTVLTGSAGLYLKKYYLVVRPYVAVTEGTPVTVSGMIRRYFSDATTYVTLSGSAGYSPDERRIQSAGGLSADQLYILRADRVGISFQKAFRSTWLLHGGVEYVRQELVADAGNYVTAYSTTIGIRKRF